MTFMESSRSHCILIGEYVFISCRRHTHTFGDSWTWGIDRDHIFNLLSRRVAWERREQEVASDFCLRFEEKVINESRQGVLSGCRVNVFRARDPVAIGLACVGRYSCNGRNARECDLDTVGNSLWIRPVVVQGKANVSLGNHAIDHGWLEHWGWGHTESFNAPLPSSAVTLQTWGTDFDKVGWQDGSSERMRVKFIDCFRHYVLGLSRLLVAKNKIDFA